MKQIKAQLSTSILQNILPLHGIDYRRDVLTENESASLFKLWKDAKRVGDKVLKPVGFDSFTISSLKNKGYIDYDSYTVAFTKKGKDVIKVLVLSYEENTFKKGGKS